MPGFPALEVARRLSVAGYRSLWAGGCVRDLILGETPADYDIATEATPEQVLAVLPFPAVTVGISFGVVRVRHPRLAGVEVEVATFRSDGAYIDGRRPESVVFSSPELDAAHRDFTINGMFMDSSTGEVIDYVGGQIDLAKRVLRAIGDPAARLREDKLRALRHRPAGGAVSSPDRASDLAGALGNDRADRDRVGRADCPGAAAHAGAPEPEPRHEPRSRHGSRRRHSAPACRHEGALSR